MGRHEAPVPADTFAAIAADYATQRARELVAQFDAHLASPPVALTPLDWAEWAGSAAEILRELTRDA